MVSWSLDMSMGEKQRLITAKSRECGIPESEAFRLCVIEYETGTKLMKTTVQTENAYNQYKLEGARPNTLADKQHKIKIANELLFKKVDALRRAKKLADEASRSVEERIDVKHGLGAYVKATRSVEDMEAERKRNWLPGWMKTPKLPKLSLPSMEMGSFFSGKTKLIVTVVGAIVLLLVFMIALGYSGLGGAAGKYAEKKV